MISVTAVAIALASGIAAGWVVRGLVPPKTREPRDPDQPSQSSAWAEWN